MDITPDDLELHNLQFDLGLTEEFVQQVKIFLHTEDPHGSFPDPVSAVKSCVKSVCENEEGYEEVLFIFLSSNTGSLRARSIIISWSVHRM